MPRRVPELTTRIDHPPQSWSRHKQTRQLPQRDDEMAISCDARTGPQHCTGDLEGCRHTATGPQIPKQPHEREIVVGWRYQI